LRRNISPKLRLSFIGLHGAITATAPNPLWLCQEVLVLLLLLLVVVVVAAAAAAAVAVGTSAIQWVF
jgi:hypothetical protein